MECGRPVTRDEAALSKKLINRGMREAYCLDCLGSRFEVSRDVLVEKIAQFRADGCTLFAADAEKGENGIL